MSDRRYTDREVALILRHAAEIEDREGGKVSARGISLEELESIARDVGLDVSRIRRAALELEGRRFRTATPLGSDASRTAVRAIDAPIHDDALRELVGAIDDHVAAPGTVTQALGTVRWQARDRWLTTQIAIAQADVGTTIKVHERIDSRLRGIMHFVPGVWGTMAGIVVAAVSTIPVLPAVAVVGGCALVGVAAGRGVWEIVSDRSRRRVELLAAELAGEAQRLARSGRVETLNPAPDVPGIEADLQPRSD